MEGRNVCKLSPGIQCFQHDRNSVPEFLNQPFTIFEERLEDQLAAEAKAYPLSNYEHDDKENCINNLVVE